jgi:polyamine oxidase
MHQRSFHNVLLVAAAAFQVAAGAPTASACRKTKVLIMGGGMAGITAAQTLSNSSISDFIIVEYNSDIGGRVAHTTFGKDPSGNPYVIELGANWVQGIQSPGGPANPIWTLAQKYNLKNTYSNYSSILTYTASGESDFTNLINDYFTAYTTVQQDAGYLLSENRQDRSLRSALLVAGWNPLGDMNAQAAEWWNFDFEYGTLPEQSSEVFAVIVSHIHQIKLPLTYKEIQNYNATFYQYSNANNFVTDQRGFNAIIKGEASTFLKANDPRLLLNTIVSGVNYTNDGITAIMEDGSCIQADYGICTFSIGVLQQGVVDFQPPFPPWKKSGIASLQMETYTKIFLQFDPAKVFWDRNTQFFLYADPIERGRYPVFQSLDSPGFFPGSGILFVTVVDRQSYRVESQTNSQTLAQVMEVLRTMFPGTNVPDPIAFMYPRWTKVPWAFGSYSNWPPSTSLEMHQNLRANVGRLWFAGEATSAEYYGFLQGIFIPPLRASTIDVANWPVSLFTSSYCASSAGRSLTYTVIL